MAWSIDGRLAAHQTPVFGSTAQPSVRQNGNMNPILNSRLATKRPAMIRARSEPGGAEKMRRWAARIAVSESASPPRARGFHLPSSQTLPRLLLDHPKNVATMPPPTGRSRTDSRGQDGWGRGGDSRTSVFVVSENRGDHEDRGDEPDTTDNALGQLGSAVGFSPSLLLRGALGPEGGCGGWAGHVQQEQVRESPREGKS